LLKLDQSSLFSGTVAGFATGDAVDLADIAFGANETIGYSPNSNNTGGTLTVSNGTDTANIALFGQYAAAGFATTADSNGGTIVTYGSSQTASGQTPLITKPTT
jgi:trimeric autotransporter adhesin